MTIGIDARAACGERAGKGQYVYYLIKELSLLNLNEQIVLYTNSELDLEENPNLKIRKLGMPSLLWHFQCLWYLLFVDKTNIFLATTSFIIPFLAPRKCVPVIMDLVAFLKITKHQAKATWTERLTVGRAVKKAKKVIAISENTKRDLIKLFSLPPEKVAVIYLAADESFKPGIDEFKLISAREKYNLPEKYFLFVSTLEPRKNVVRLIEAYNLARGQNSNFPKLVITGKKGWYYQEIFQTVEKLRLSDSVQFTAYVNQEDLPALYSQSLAYLFPSLYEGFGITILEAMACGVPVLTSYASSLPEVAGSAAWYCDPLNTDQIATGIKELYQNENLRHTLIDNGLKQAQKFSFSKMAKETLKSLVL
ncbi:MAG: group 1 glycosyl transferase [uncultured bacterium]|nr:MAG: group 1 glycosyl transferase [uncultured bacterium]